jgi:hypothetical protein
VVDYGTDGRPLGVEITSPDVVTLDRLNGLLAGLGQSPVAEQEFDRSGQHRAGVRQHSPAPRILQRSMAEVPVGILHSIEELLLEAPAAGHHIDGNPGCASNRNHRIPTIPRTRSCCVFLNSILIRSTLLASALAWR